MWRRVAARFQGLASCRGTSSNRRFLAPHGMGPSGAEIVCLGRDSRYAQTFSYHLFTGGQVGIKTMREFDPPCFCTQQVWRRSFALENGDLVDAVVPFMGESITDGTLAAFLKTPGDRVEVDEAIAQIETDKVTIDVVSPEAGIIQKFVAKEGETVTPGTRVAMISKSDAGITHAALSEEKSDKDVPKPSPPAEKESTEKQKHKPEPPSITEKPKVPSHSTSSSLCFRTSASS